MGRPRSVIERGRGRPPRHSDMALLAVLLALLTPLAASAQPAASTPATLSATQVAEDVELARRAYAKVHPGYDRYTSVDVLNAAWDAVVDDAEHAGGMPVGTFYLRVQGVLAQIRCDHTKAELSPAQVERRENEPVYLPLHWEVIDGRGVIWASADERISPRSELLSVDGVSVSDLADRYAPLVPIDGFTEPSREGELGYSSEFRGGVIEHFAAEEGPVEPAVRLEVRNPEGAVETMTAQRLTLDAWTALAGEVRPFRLDFADAVDFQRIGDDAAVLRIDTFVNYRNPVKPDRIYDRLFKAMRKEARTTLILDLRRNGGGSSDAQVRLFAHLIEARSRLVRDVRNETLELGDLRSHLSTWNARALKPRKRWFKVNADGTYSLRPWLDEAMRRVRPDRWAFEGELIVLTSRDNASAVSTLLAKLAEQDNVTLVGEPTGGSAEGVTANTLFFLTLPHSKIVTRLPAQRIYNDVQTFEHGMGVAPDIVVHRTAEDALAGRDRAMERALALAGG